MEKEGLDMLQCERESTDVIVTMENGDRYVAAFFAYKYIEMIRQLNFQSGEFIKGKYFWVKNMVLVDSCCREDILNVIENIIEEGNFESVFEKL